MKKKHIGRCALCRKECELTFEHIPPSAALNDKPVKGVSGEDFIGLDRMPWDFADLPYINLQRGFGRYSLCRECNNNTGAWYCEDYLRVAKAACGFLALKKKEYVEAFGLREFYPLRFIKQVVSMFCSINNDEDDRMIPLRQFVLDRNATDLDASKYKLCMYFTESQLVKQNGISDIYHRIPERIKANTISEITAYPLGFLLYFDPTEDWEYRGIDITSLSKARYDEYRDQEFPLLIFEVNSWMTEDFRSKIRIEECIKNSKVEETRREEHGR